MCDCARVLYRSKVGFLFFFSDNIVFLVVVVLYILSSLDKILAP